MLMTSGLRVKNIMSKTFLETAAAKLLLGLGLLGGDLVVVEINNAGLHGIPGVDADALEPGTQHEKEAGSRGAHAEESRVRGRWSRGPGGGGRGSLGGVYGKLGVSEEEDGEAAFYRYLNIYIFSGQPVFTQTQLTCGNAALNFYLNFLFEPDWR